MADKLVKICKGCGTALPDFPFAEGDKVRHMNGAEGSVYGVGLAVLVQFDGYTGAYDQGWFNAYPNDLTKI